MRPLVRNLLYFWQCVSFCLLLVHGLSAQEKPPSSSGNPVRLTLQDALERAQHNSVVYQAAATDARLASEDTKQAVAGLLPSVSYNNSAIFTQSNGVSGQVRFIANNALHEYISQGNVHEALSVASFADALRASSNAAAARARQQIALRGLAVTVVQRYYAAASAAKKLEGAQKAADEGDRFLKLTQDLERGGEVAHSDVIKAELQVNDRHRQLQEAKLAFLNERLDLAVLVFPTFNDNFELADDLHAPTTLPTYEEVAQRASHENPEIRAALEAVSAAGHEVFSARAGYLPSLSLDYFYGIDATHFATKTDGVSNLGSSAVATLNIPIWNWGATQSKVRQAELQRDQAKRALSLAQRKLLADLKSLYAEAQTAADQLAELQRSAELGAESLRLITLRYKNGESTVLEVVDAQNVATATDVAFHDGAVRYRVALTNLQKLTGTVTTP